MTATKHFKKAVFHAIFFLLLSTLLLFSISMDVSATDAIANWDSLHVYGNEELENTKINLQTIDGDPYLILPSNISPEEVKLHIEADNATVLSAKNADNIVQLSDGDALNLTELYGENTIYAVTLQATNGEETDEFFVKIAFSTNVSSMYLTSDDPVNKGRTWVESSADKSNKATGSMIMQNADSTIVYDGALTQIKGRGNSTWVLPKKPYQIKLDSKTDLLQTGDSSNKSKTWVLLANYSDSSFMRNTLALSLGTSMGMTYSIQHNYVDLYYDGEYRGNYLLTEKVEIGSGRVDITDMEELNEEANPDTDLDAFPIATGSTENGASYTYCVGMTSPSDITGGYLLEMETSYRAVDEACYFWTSRGEYVVVKSPEFCTQEQMNYIATLYQEYEDAVFNNGINPTTNKAYTEYVDLKSTAQCYLINELAKNLDGFRTSAYLYKEVGQDMMYMGPLWDYDLGFGVGAGSQTHVDLQKDPTGLYTARGILAGTLYEFGDFRVAAKNVWVNDLYPLLSNIVLGSAEAVSDDGTLHSIAYYTELLNHSAVCDYIKWRGTGNSSTSSWRGSVDYLTSYLSARTTALNEIITTWNADTYEKIPYLFDVPFDSWYHDEVASAVRHGIMRGSGVNMFNPENLATRAQVAQTIFNMEDPSDYNYEAIFSDVSTGEYYTYAVCWGAKNDVINGYPDGTFRPDDVVTREDLVTLLYRYSGVAAPESELLSGFVDASSVSHYAVDAMEWAISEDIIHGYPGQVLRPQNSTSRAELAAILVRFYEKYVIDAA